MKLTDIISSVNPFRQKASSQVNATKNPLPNFGGIIGGRAIYPSLGYQKYIEDYMQNSEVYSVVKRISKTVSTVPFYVYKIKSTKELNRYKSIVENASSTADIARAELARTKAVDEIADSPLNKLLEHPNE